MTGLVGAAVIIAAAASWGTIGLAESYLPAGADPVSVAAARTLVGGLVLAGYAVRPASVRATVASRRTLGALVVGGCAMACYQGVYFLAIRLAGAGIASVVTMSSVPLFSGVLCRMTGGRLSRRWRCQVAFAVVGCGLLGLHGLFIGRHVLAGLSCALAAGLLYAVFTLAVAGVIRAGGPPTATMGLVFAGAGLLMAPYLVAGSRAWLATVSGAAVVVYLGVVATAVAYVLYAHGLRSVPVHVAATLILAEPACSTVLAVAVLDDRLTALAWAGLGLLAVALLASAAPGRGDRRHGRHIVGGGEPVAAGPQVPVPGRRLDHVGDPAAARMRAPDRQLRRRASRAGHHHPGGGDHLHRSRLPHPDGRPGQHQVRRRCGHTPAGRWPG